MPRYNYNYQQQRRGALPTLAGMFGGGQVKQISAGGMMTSEAGQPITGSYVPPQYAPKNRFLDMLSGGGGAAQAQEMNFAVQQMMRQSELERALRKETEAARLSGDKELRGMDLERAKYEAGEREKLQSAKYNQDRDIQILTNVAKIFADKGIPFDGQSIPMLVKALQGPTLDAALAKVEQDKMVAEDEQNRLTNVAPLERQLQAQRAKGMLTSFDTEERGRVADIGNKTFQAEADFNRRDEIAKNRAEMEKRTLWKEGIVPSWSGNMIYSPDGQPRYEVAPNRPQPENAMKTLTEGMLKEKFPQYFTNQPSGTLTPPYRPMPASPQLGTPPALGNTNETITINGRTYRRKQ